MIIATANAIRPSSSAAAKPMNSRPCWLSAAAGLRIALSRDEPNTLPTPIAAAPTPTAARPAPITWAEARSMKSLLGFEGLVKVDGVVDVERGQQREHVGLDGADQHLQRHHAGDEHEREQADRRADAAGVEALDDEAAEHLDEDVARDHRDEQPQREAERAHHEGEQLYEEDERQQDHRRAVRDEQREETEAVPPEADDQHDREADDRHHPGDGELARHRERL